MIGAAITSTHRLFEPTQHHETVFVPHVVTLWPVPVEPEDRISLVAKTTNMVKYEKVAIVHEIDAPTEVEEFVQEKKKRMDHC